MKNLKKYIIAAALVVPAVLSVNNESKASSAILNNNRATVVNVRSEAKEANNIIGQITDKTEYEVTGEENGWLQIDFNGETGYVGAYWFNVNEDAKVTSAASLRSEATMNSNLLDILQVGDVVKPIEWAANDYVKVNYNGEVAYVYSENLALSDSFLASKPVYKTYTNYSYSQPSYSDNSYSYNDYSDYSYSEPSYSNSSSQGYTGSSSNAKEIIAQRESGGSYTATNGQYYGRYQLSSSYLNGDYSPENQERVADEYVSNRYGSWDAALDFWNANGWY